MGQINKIRLLGKTIQSQKPTFSKPSKMAEVQAFSIAQKDADGYSIGDFEFDISLKSLKSFNNSDPICDEILIDLVEEKTYHIRRVGVCILDSLTGVYNANGELFNGYTIPTDFESNSAFEPNSYIHSYCDKMCTQENEIENFNANREFCGNLNSDKTDKWFFRIKASTVGKNTNIGFSEWSQSTQITIYAKLQEPIITEIEHIWLDPSASKFEIYSPEAYNKLVPDLVIEYEKDYEVAIKEVETEIDGIENEIVELQSSKSDKSTLSTIKVDVPIWTYQPTVSGNLDSSFKLWNEDLYYVTLKDTSGNSLATNQFKLTTTYNGYATAINQIFTLANLATGNAGTLFENCLVDFHDIGASFKLRIAGVVNFTVSMKRDQKLKFSIQANLYIPTTSCYLLFAIPNNPFYSLNATGKQEYYVILSSSFSNTKKYHSYAIGGELSFDSGNKIGNLKCNISGGHADKYDFSTGYQGITKNTQPETTLFFNNDITSNLNIVISGSYDTPFFRNGTIFKFEHI